MCAVAGLAGVRWPEGTCRTKAVAERSHRAARKSRHKHEDGDVAQAVCKMHEDERSASGGWRILCSAHGEVGIVL